MFKNRYYLKGIAAVLVICVMLVFTGCSGAATNADKDGNLLVYGKDDLPEGVFVKTKTRFYPVMPNGLSFNNTAEKADPIKRGAWFTADKENLLPVCGKDDQLVFKTTGSSPEIIRFEYMADAGYTIGVKLKRDGKSNGWRLEEVCKDSSFKFNSDETAQSISDAMFSEINGQSLQPGHMTSAGTIKGLAENESYVIGLYNGTVYSELSAAADTRLFVSDAVRDAPGYAVTKYGYAIITPPDGLVPGVYCITGDKIPITGLFMYNPQ